MLLERGKAKAFRKIFELPEAARSELALCAIYWHVLMLAKFGQGVLVMSKNNSVFAWLFASLGLAGAGFAAGLHRLVWLFFWVLTILWVGFFYSMIQDEHSASLSLAAQGYHTKDDQTIYWIIAIGAPIVVAIILRIVEGVAIAFLGEQKRDQS